MIHKCVTSFKDDHYQINISVLGFFKIIGRNFFSEFGKDTNSDTDSDDPRNNRGPSRGSNYSQAAKP